MSPIFILSTLAISSALLFYTVGVFAERRSNTLKGWHLICFWCGLALDTTGTLMMSSMAAASQSTIGVHGITGMLAIVLMLFHAGWATFVFFRGSQRARTLFHTFSTIVWLVWLVPYFIGMLIGIPAIHLKTVCAVGTAVLVVGVLAFVLLRPRKGHHA